MNYNETCYDNDNGVKIILLLRGKRVEIPREYYEYNFKVKYRKERAIKNHRYQSDHYQDITEYITEQWVLGLIRPGPALISYMHSCFQTLHDLLVESHSSFSIIITAFQRLSTTFGTKFTVKPETFMEMETRTSILFIFSLFKFGIIILEGTFGNCTASLSVVIILNVLSPCSFCESWRPVLYFLALHRKQQRDRLNTAQHRYTGTDWGRLSPTAINLPTEIKDDNQSVFRSA